MLHDSVGAESWKRLSAVASVNPQEDKEMAIRSCSPQRWGRSLGGGGGCRTVSEALFEICWAYLLFGLRIYARQTRGLSLPQYHCEMVRNKLGGDWVSGGCRKTPWHPAESLWPLASSSETWKSPGESSACLSYSAPPPPTLPRHALLSRAIPLLTPHHSLLAPQKTLHQQAASHACS